MGITSTETVTHFGHSQTTPLPRTSAAASTPSQSQIAAIEFSMFADTVREDLAPSSLLEHVLTERVVVAAWRLHKLSLDETKSASVSGIILPLGREAIEAEASLDSALTLLEAARAVQNPGWGRAEFPVSKVEEAAETGPDDTADVYNPFLADASNEYTVFGDFPENRPADDDAVEYDVLGADEVDANVPRRWQDRLVLDFNVSETSPVVRGTWVTVNQVVSRIVDGWSWADILRSHPELTEDDIRTCLAYTIELDDQGEF